MNHHLLTIAIGPVQEFIASARRSRDLWFGSWLLSELSKAAANKIADGNEKRLIFPAVSDLADLKPATKSQEANGYFSVVNKITAVVETDNVSQFAEGVFDAMKERLKNLRLEAFNRIEKSQYFDPGRAKLQIDDLIEYYGASVPLPDEKHYATARQKAESLLVARKNTRDFNSAREWAQEGVPKSSLDGLRESVIKKGAYEELSDEERRRKFETRPGERLCGVGLLKRLGNGQDEEGFFSTSHVAAFPLLSNLKEANKDAVSEYFAILEKLQIGKSAWSRVSGNGSSEVHQLIASIFQKRENQPCDGRLLFEDRFAEYFEKSEPQKVRDAKSALRKFLKSALGDRKPLPYYALLLADGDGMGEAIKGLDESGKHRALSSKLGTFAKGVRAVVETGHHGSLIYAGGDDVLAFVPVHQIVQCAKALAQDFKTALSNGQRQTPTLSIGVAICHHLDPLSDALSLAREAEKVAKRLPGKNALCIKLDKRSGETTTVVDHWGKLDERLKFFTLLFVADKLPDGVAYEFHKLAEQLRYVPAAIPGEVKRILKRKRAGHGEEELDKKVIARLWRDLKDLDNANPKDGSLVRLAEELIVSRALAAAREQSHPSQEAAKVAAQGELVQLLKESINENGDDNANLAD
jgi:CRISPR-associated protein Cmr2